MEDPKKPRGSSAETRTRVTSGRPERSPSVAEQIRANKAAKVNTSPGSRVPSGSRDSSVRVLSYRPKFECDITDAVGIVKVRNGKGMGDLYAVIHTSGGIVRIRSTAGKEFKVEKSYMSKRTRMLAGSYF